MQLGFTTDPFFDRQALLDLISIKNRMFFIPLSYYFIRTYLRKASDVSFKISERFG